MTEPTTAGVGPSAMLRGANDGRRTPRSTEADAVSSSFSDSKWGSAAGEESEVTGWLRRSKCFYVLRPQWHARRGGTTGRAKTLGRRTLVLRVR